MGNINGIITKVYKVKNQNKVHLNIDKNVGTKEFTRLHVEAVGDAADSLISMLDNDNLPFGKDSKFLSIIEDSEWDFTESHLIQARRFSWVKNLNDSFEKYFWVSYVAYLTTIKMTQVKVNIIENKKQKALT